MRKRMRARGSDYQTVLCRKVCYLTPEYNELPSRIARIAADLGADFHNRLMELGFDLLLQYHSAVGKNLLDVRTQFPRLRIDDLQFFLDSEGENVIGVARSRRRFLRFR